MGSFILHIKFLKKNSVASQSGQSVYVLIWQIPDRCPSESIYFHSELNKDIFHKAWGINCFMFA